MAPKGTIKNGDLDALYAFLFQRAQEDRAQGLYDDSKALLKHLLRQKHVSRKQRKEARMLLAAISLETSGKTTKDGNPPSRSKLNLEGARLRTRDFFEAITTASKKLFKGAEKPKEPTIEEVLEFHNQQRMMRIRRESGADLLNEGSGQVGAGVVEGALAEGGLKSRVSSYASHVSRRDWAIEGGVSRKGKEREL